MNIQKKLFFLRSLLNVVDVVHIKVVRTVPKAAQMRFETLKNHNRCSKMALMINFAIKIFLRSTS
jgi:hypothetical protein